MATSTVDLIDETLDGLRGFTGLLENFSTLLSTVDTGDFQFQYDLSQSLGRGLAEVDDELVYIQSVDDTAGVAKIAPWGRGQGGTAAADHTYGSKITAQPRFPRKRVLDKLVQTVNRMSADLFLIADTEFVGQAAVMNYPLPAGVTQVLQVEQQTYGPSLMWENLSRWRLDHNADTTVFPSGVSVTFPRGVLPGRNVRVTYAADLTPLSETGLLTDTGLAESTRDLVVMGAQAKLLMSQDFLRTQLGAVEQQQRNAEVPVTSATKIASQLEAMFQVRMGEEQRQLYRFFPTAIYRSN